MNVYESQTESCVDRQSVESNKIFGEMPDREPPSPTLRVLIANEQSTLTIDESRLQAAIRSVFGESCYDAGTVSLAVVDDPTIHEINRQYLNHDYPTDVLSFVLEERRPYLEGELIVSTDTAARNATHYGWPASSELLLYVIHGALHLVGFLDKRPNEIDLMRAAEAKHLEELGVPLPEDASRWSGNGQPNDFSFKSVGETDGTSDGAGGEAPSS